jgi:serpin B
MEQLMKHKNLSKIIQAFLLLCLTGCSMGSGLIPSTGGSAEIISNLPRADSGEIPRADLDQLAVGNRDFALDLYHRLAAKEGNLFYSPYSISAALAMTYAGAEGATEEEMAAVLHFILEEDRLHQAFNTLDQYLENLADQEIDQEVGEPFQLNIANAIWGQQDFHFEEAFLDILATNYGAGLRLLDYIQEPEASRITINDWVSDQTRERIQDLIPQGAINSDTRLVLSNAIYFKATWLEPFEESLTEDGIFQGLNGQELMVPMMKMGSDTNLPYYQGEGYLAYEMPYLGGQTSMVVLVPDQGSFENFESGLDGARLDQIINGLEYHPMYLTMPKFEFESEVSLAQELAAMGMPSAFSEAADFSGMTGNQDLFISDVFHKAFVSVDEEGTEAAAATAVVMKLTSAPANPLNLVIDRPFLFLIRDHQTNSILFFGRVVEP